MVERGVGKTELGKAIGVSRSTIASWCEGRTVPCINKTILLVRFFGVCLIILRVSLMRDDVFKIATPFLYCGDYGNKIIS